MIRKDLDPLRQKKLRVFQRGGIPTPNRPHTPFIKKLSEIPPKPIIDDSPYLIKFIKKRVEPLVYKTIVQQSREESIFYISKPDPKDDSKIIVKIAKERAIRKRNVPIINVKGRIAKRIHKLYLKFGTRKSIRKTKLKLQADQVSNYKSIIASNYFREERKEQRRETFKFFEKQTTSNVVQNELLNSLYGKMVPTLMKKRIETIRASSDDAFIRSANFAIGSILTGTLQFVQIGKLEYESKLYNVYTLLKSSKTTHNLPISTPAFLCPELDEMFLEPFFTISINSETYSTISNFSFIPVAPGSNINQLSIVSNQSITSTKTHFTIFSNSSQPIYDFSLKTTNNLHSVVASNIEKIHLHHYNFFNPEPAIVLLKGNLTGRDYSGLTQPSSSQPSKLFIKPIYEGISKKQWWKIFRLNYFLFCADLPTHIISQQELRFEKFHSEGLIDFGDLLQDGLDCYIKKFYPNQIHRRRVNFFVRNPDYLPKLY